MKNSILKPALGAFIIAVCISLVSGQDEKKTNDILLLKNGTQLVGQVASITDNDITIKLEKDGSATIQITDIESMSAYKIKLARIDPNNAKAHIELGDFAFKNALYTIAEQEYNKTIELDESLKDTIAKKLDDVSQTYAKSLFEEGTSLMKADKLEDAVKKFAFVSDKYPQSPYAAQAKDELTKATAIIKERTEKKLAELEETKRKIAEQKAKEEKGKIKGIFEQSVKLIGDSKKANADGLTWEAKGNFTNAMGAYQKAEALLMEAWKDIDSVINSAKDEDVIKAAQEKTKDVDQFLVTVYGNVANMYAIADNFTEAIVWINKALAIDPLDKFTRDLKLVITEAKIRARAQQQQPQYSPQQTPK